MTARIVVFGATGHTGGLLAARLAAAGARPLLAGRDSRRLSEVARRLGGLPHAVADAGRPETVADLLDERTVLVSTVGPFGVRGHGVIGAAIQRRATYIDSTGEPAFIRAVFEGHGPRAGRAGVRLLPAMGYDYAPGALAGGLALAEAGAAATRVEIGYFLEGGARGGATSAGTRRSAAAALLEPSFAYRDGALRSVRLADRGRRMWVGGRRRAVVSVGGSEHFGLPAVHQGLLDVEVYAGFFGATAPVVRVVSALAAGVARVPAAPRLLRPALEAYAGRGEPPAGGGESLVVARAYAGDGSRLAAVELRGPEPYTLTAGILAWAATESAATVGSGAGALGPVAAFGLPALRAGCASAGLERVA